MFSTEVIAIFSALAAPVYFLLVAILVLMAIVAFIKPPRKGLVSIRKSFLEYVGNIDVEPRKRKRLPEDRATTTTAGR